ncbi:hypothetical protein ACOI1H_20230 [Loktanella sp. DJP18]|uniref:hypothetical protein n=1 Tax=Loktanella sp. DJP18 TaxID=3409788 RepID=UPI003BB6A05F
MQAGIAETDFDQGFALFRKILKAHEPMGRDFTDFRSGVIDGQEGYKSRVHALARTRLGLGDWPAFKPGEGDILRRVIGAIAIPENNVLTWWPPAFAHRDLVRIEQDGGGECAEIELLLRDLYLDTASEGEIFDALVEMLGKNYPLLGYLFFVKDMDRFVPVTPGGIQRGLAESGCSLKLKGRASWLNYQDLLSDLRMIQGVLAARTASDVRLIDAHSFAWVLGSWRRPGEDGKVPGVAAGSTVTDAAEKALRRMAFTIKDTIKNANGQMVLKKVKEKGTNMSDAEIDAYLLVLMKLGRTCRLTGCHMLYDGEAETPFDRHFLVSADRIDSSLGYVRGNIQLVCQFANFFKGHRYNDDVFRLLLARVAEVEVIGYT